MKGSGWVQAKHGIRNFGFDESLVGKMQLNGTMKPNSATGSRLANAFRQARKECPEAILAYGNVSFALEVVCCYLFLVIHFFIF